MDLTTIKEKSNLSETQLNQLTQDGYTIIDNLDIDKIIALKKIYLEKFTIENHGKFQSTMTVVEGENFRQDIFNHIQKNCQKIVQEFLPEYEILLGNFLNKPANSPLSEVGVHRDWSYVNHSLDNAYNFWIPLDDINDENGSFFVIPNSQNINHGPRVTPFQDELGTFKNHLIRFGKPMHVKKGQAIIYHPGIIHYSLPNHSPNNRLVVGMVCKPIEQKAYHYFWDKDKNCRKYEVDSNFYNTFNPQFEPSSEYQFTVTEDAIGEPDLVNWIKEKEKIMGFSPESIGEYYDRTTEDYLATYGNTIQAFRPDNENELHQYVIKSAKLKKHQNILDAGCGVGGPAIFFAKKLNINILGLSISQHQIALANKFLQKKWLRGQVNFQVGDYHQMSQFAAKSSIDRVLFLESLGHSHQPKVAITEAFKVLKPGGAVYVKDFFPYDFEEEDLQKKYHQVVQNINEAYCYHTLDLNTTIKQFRQAGFEVGYIKKFEFADDIIRRAAFETKQNIDLFGDIPEFRVAEWLELYFIKP